MPEGLPARSHPSAMASASIKSDRKGNIWASVGRTVYRYDGETFVKFMVPIKQNEIESYAITAAHASLKLEDRDGTSTSSNRCGRIP